MHSLTRSINLPTLLITTIVEIILAYETLLSLGLYFSAMLGIGLYAYRKSTSDVAGSMIFTRTGRQI